MRMSNTLYGDIRAALTARLASFPYLPDVAWENSGYKPQPDVPYLKPTVLWAEPSQAETGENGANWERGIYQIDLNYPLMEGAGPQNDMAGQLREWFKRGTELVYNGVTVKVRKVYLNPTGNVLSIAYYCYAAN